MFARFYDKVFCGLALVFALGMATWVPLRKLPVKAAPANVGLAYEPAPVSTPLAKMKTWPELPTGEGEWRYDVFTPPVIYYDPFTKEFSVTPAGAHKSSREVPFGFELREVRRTPCRLQLVGYVGGNGDHLGTFQNTLTGEIFLARTGRQLPGLGLTITGFEVQRVRLERVDSMSMHETVAVAAVHDDRTGEDFTLTTQRRLWNGPLQAVLTAGGVPTELHVLKEGEEIESHGAVYRVEKIQITPPQVVVTKTPVGSSESVRKILEPAFVAVSRQTELP